MMNGWGFGGTGAWLMILLSIVVVAAVIVGIVFLVRGLGGGGTAGGSTPQADLRESPQDILKRRYAAGEIDRDEYEKALSDLRA